MTGASVLELPVQDVVLRLVLATVLGGLIGVERERLERSAGLRTHAIVALAAALIMIVSAYGFADVLQSEQGVSLDPSRIAAQVVSGIGFLGAGVIIFRENTVRGLTTAASIWAVAGLGLACGSGLFAVAAVAAVLLLLLQVVLRPLERRFFGLDRRHRVELRMRRDAGSLAAVEAVLSRMGITVQGMRIRPAREDGEDRVEVDLGPVPSERMARVLDALRALDGARLVSYSTGDMPASDTVGNGSDDGDGARSDRRGS